MRKNKIYLILAIIISLTLFTTAAICNQCQAEEKAIEEDVSQEVTEKVEVLEAPTIELNIYSSPTYSSTDGACYYRVKAVVTGSPVPDIEFFKDDSNGAWLPKKVQINLDDPSETYTLTATATNLESTATDSITLNWGCEEETKEEASKEIELGESNDIQEANITTTELKVVIYECGYLIRNEEVLHKYDFIQYIGDTGQNNPCRGFISYDIASISGVTVESVQLTLTLFRGESNPLSFYPISFYVTSWGSKPVNQSDYALTGILVGQSYNENIVYGSTTLKDKLQRAIDDGKDRFQIMFYFTGLETNGNNQWDDWTYSAQANGHFIVNHIP
ncbi:MAG: hypothetical protein H8E13_07220 [Actinobacteria bacterium]|nr:hypothetical protein [Actinomycetota bacterium]